MGIYSKISIISDKKAQVYMSAFTANNIGERLKGYPVEGRLSVSGAG